MPKKRPARRRPQRKTPAKRPAPKKPQGRVRTEIIGAPPLRLGLPWDVSPERLKILLDEELNSLMRELLLAETYRCEGDVSKFLPNTEIKAKDKGCDGWSPAVPKPNHWLSAFPICWQFKAGKNGTPAKIKSEVVKPIPSETLRSGGGFALVSSAAVQGKALRLCCGHAGLGRGGTGTAGGGAGGKAHGQSGTDTDWHGR